MDIKVKYFDPEMPKLVKDEKGDWIDLSVANVMVCPNDESVIKQVIKNRCIGIFNGENRINYNTGDVIVMRLGVAIQLPADKKAQVIARSSIFAGYGLILTNGVGAIDNKYQGDEDEWLAVFYATRKGYITKYDRMCQFDIVDRMNVTIEEVGSLGDTNRGGFGTTGKNKRKDVK